jgi:4-hydroxy-tetrahydrodipicolinate reductase
VVVVGSGQMGSGIVRLLLEKRGLELVGVCGRRTERAGTDVGLAVGLGRSLDLALASDLGELVERTRPDVAIQATCSRLADARGEIEELLRRGVNVISIAEELAYPVRQHPELAARIDRLAVEHGASVLGTGINPGFVLDLLVIALSGVCARVESITATRVNDLSPYGPSVLASQGVGLTPQAFRQGVEAGTVVGHFGFPESIGMIAAALGIEVERIEQEREPIVSRVRRETEFVTVEPGQAAGCRHTAVAFSQGRPVVTLHHPQQVHPQLEEVETLDAIEIAGEPCVHISGRPEIPGGVGTIALAVNCIPRVLDAPPGLLSMADVPPPAALMGDVRDLLRAHPETT